MPHLDANALSADPEGLDFLKQVLDDSAATPQPWGAFDVTSNAASAKRSFDGEVNRPRRLALEPETA